jgi:hypothetical protein
MANRTSKAYFKPLRSTTSYFNPLRKSVNSSMQIYGVMKYNTILDEDNMKSEIQRFEKMLSENKNGIIAADLKSEYIQIKPDPKLIDADTLAFIDSKILRQYGVSLPILTGDFTPEQYQSFYEKTLEPQINSLNQVFTKSLFTTRERNLETRSCSMPITSYTWLWISGWRSGICLGNRGALTNNELLGLFGYPPYDGGNVRLMSLNYVDVNIANQYQMNKTKTSSEVPPNEPQK